MPLRSRLRLGKSPSHDRDRIGLAVRVESRRRDRILVPRDGDLDHLTMNLCRPSLVGYSPRLAVFLSQSADLREPLVAGQEAYRGVQGAPGGRRVDLCPGYRGKKEAASPPTSAATPRSTWGSAPDPATGAAPLAPCGRSPRSTPGQPRPAHRPPPESCPSRNRSTAGDDDQMGGADSRAPAPRSASSRGWPRVSPAGVESAGLGVGAERTWRGRTRWSRIFIVPRC